MTTRITIVRERVTIVRESTTDDEPPPVADDFANLPALFEKPRRQPKRVAARPLLLLAAPAKGAA